MIRTISTIVAGAAACVLLASPVLALPTRTWVSGAGNDQAGCGPIATPCRSLQYAHDNTAPGGEIDVKDSAGYGSVVINKSISIIGDGSLAGVLAATNGTAITINAGLTDIVVLRGLLVEGAGIGAYGIIMNGVGQLDISNCTIQNFQITGVYMVPTSGTPIVRIAHTTISHNSGGLLFGPSGNTSGTITLDHVTSSYESNGPGFSVNAVSTSGAVKFLISNSIATNNNGSGFFISGATATGAIDLSSSAFNTGHGFAVDGGKLSIGRSVAANNTLYGLANISGSVSSFGSSQFSGNSSGLTTGTITPAPLQ